MNYGELKSYLQSLINRTDITDTLAGQFIKQSIDRLQRVSRPQFMERTQQYTADGTNTLVLPSDYVELANLYTSQGELEQIDMREFVNTTEYVGTPRYFVRVGANIKLKPTPEEGTEITLHYYGTEPDLLNSTDENGWSVSAVDAVVYGAAELAGDFYEDDRTQRFAQKYATALAELQEQIINDSFSGPLSIRPAYSFQDDWDY
ncbi:hypothetical protein BSL82_03350 [Tardibacter chloracetimidivorans]|uniref:Uncharacterized protein n=1 Tax=Tardibacter chloracetimidivorans TaxID=1921510 RepID=A0A1L3ZS52_9SPHN|nr:hypothetical protein [Tardibacter chloracetimidivorans]API58453.1 hypothetical protein BSL82_03350 [Tardibacter chloracetimidivorans]